MHRGAGHFPRPELTLAEFRLRKETAKDEAFLRRLFIVNRWEQFFELPEPQRRALLTDQFGLQDRHFRTFFPETDRQIVMASGKAIGRFYVLRGEREHNLVDISLMPDWTGKGIGSRLLDSFVAGAEAAGVPAVLHAAINNPARSLYQRKGFVDVRLDGADWLMERLPSAAQLNTAS